jgi:hypothetical protein
MIAMVKGGATSGFYWNPQAEQGPECPGCLWTPTDRPDGGGELPMYGLVSRFAAAFPPGTRYESVPVSGDGVRVLANDRTVLVVNTRDRALTAKVDGRTVGLQAYEVTWLTR